MINENTCKKYEKTFEAQIPSVHVLKLNLYNIIFGFQHNRNLFLSGKHLRFDISIYPDIYYQYIDVKMFRSMTALVQSIPLMAKTAIFSKKKKKKNLMSDLC